MNQPPIPTLIKGHILRFKANPFENAIEDAVILDPAGAILLKGDKISTIGKFSDLRMRHPEATVVEYGDKIVMSGFVDAHVHYPQTGIIASWGKRLIDWLNSYTFPEEMRFGDYGYAREISKSYLDFVTAHGTTTVASYGTIHPESVDAFFTEAQSRNMCVVAGKTCMDRNAPDGLRDTAQSAYDDSAALLGKWHRQHRLHYAITPRFSPTSTPEQLEAMGALWAENPTCLMQTHLSEQVDEIAWVKELFPDARDYLDTYEQFGLLGERGLYGHAIHLEPREKGRLKDVGAGLVHCPTSNMFIGSGLFQTAALAQAGHRIGLATDTGGGSSYSMLRTMAAAYEVGQLNHTPLHAAQLLWLATVGSAQTLHLENEIGNVREGNIADLVVLDLHSTPEIHLRSARANDIWESIFPTIMMGDDRAIHDVWIAGQKVTP